MNDALLNLLVCPITHSKLRHEGDYLISETGGLKYPQVKDNLPILLPTAAQLPPPFQSIEEFKASIASRPN